MNALHLVIRGAVQGIGYRYALVDAANAVGVTGWVRNRRDGTVEAFVQGESAALDTVVAWCHRGPAAARVSNVEIDVAPPDPRVTAFEMRPTQ